MATVHPSDLLCVTTTTACEEQAHTIGRALVERRLAACVQIQGPIRSIYWWQDEVQDGEEWLCVAKTVGRKYVDVERLIQDLHTYDQPEVIAVPIKAGSEGYLYWVQEELAERDEPG